MKIFDKLKSYFARKSDALDNLKYTAKEAGKALFKIAGVLALTIAGMIWWAYATTVIWAWFIVPTFGLPALSIPVVMGITVLAAFYRAKKVENLFDKEETLSEAFGYLYILPACALGMGYVIKQFM